MKAEIKTALSNLTASQKTRISDAYNDELDGTWETLTASEKLDVVADDMINYLKERVRRRERQIIESDFDL